MATLYGFEPSADDKYLAALHAPFEIKVELALRRIKEYTQGERVLVAFSGGKDSQAVYHLCEDAGIDFKAEYSITRFEPPELLRFVRRYYPGVTLRRAYKSSLIAEIELRGLPNMWARWCCKAKHLKTPGFDFVILGIRWEESPSRRDTWRMFGFKQDGTKYLNPVCDWTAEDVWQYLGNRPHCKLYDEGMSRIGCVCCPLAPRHIQDHVDRWPKTAAVLRSGADKFVARMRAAGFVTARGKECKDWCKAERPEEEYWARWAATGQTGNPITTNVEANEPCLFTGTGLFDEI